MAKPQKRVPVILEEIMEAISHLKDMRGSTKKNILSQLGVMATMKKKNSRNTLCQIERALHQGVAAGLLRHKAGKYKLALDSKDYQIFKNFRHCKGGMSDARAGRRVKRRKMKSRRRRKGRQVPSTEPDEHKDVSQESSVEELNTQLQDGVREAKRRRKSKKRRSSRRRKNSRGYRAASLSDNSRDDEDPEDRGKRRKRRKRSKGKKRRRRSRSQSGDFTASDAEDVSPLHSNFAIESTRPSREKSRPASRRNSRSANLDTEVYPSNPVENNDPIPNCGNPQCICHVIEKDAG